MNDRSLWLLALSDIVAVIPLRGIRETMSCMSLLEIKPIAVCATSMDEIFADEDIIPAKTTRLPSGKGLIDTIELGLGGQWVLALDEDGALTFYRTLDLDTPLLTVRRPECKAACSWDLANALIRTVRGQYVVIVSECYHASRFVSPSMPFR